MVLREQVNYSAVPVISQSLMPWR